MEDLDMPFHVWTLCCGLAFMIFLLIAAIFGILKGRAAILISGFNTLPKQERENYNTSQMAKDHRNYFLIYAAVTGVGALLAHFISEQLGIASLIVLAVLFFKDVHLDEKKAFGKYRKEM